MVVSFVGMVIFHESRKGMDSLLSEDDRKKVQDAITVLKNLSEGNETGRESSSSSSGRPTGASSSGVGASSGRPSGASSSGAGASSVVSGTSGSKSTGDVDSPSCSGILNRVVLSN